MAASSAVSLYDPASEHVTEIKNKIYELCSREPDKVFRQDDLFSMNLIPDRDINALMTIIQRLVDEKLFKTVSRDGTPGWMYRSEAEAKKYFGLTKEAEMVYGVIDDAHTEGIWLKAIKLKLNMPETAVRAALKSLEGKRLVAEMRSVEYPTRKMYIKASLQPSDKATGGPWYTDNELDEAFIDMIAQTLYRRICERSFSKPTGPSGIKKPRKTKPGSSTKHGSGEGGRSSKSTTSESRVKREDEDRWMIPQQRNMDQFLPLPPGYQGYPTLRELTLYIANSGVTETPLSTEEIQALLDILCYDRQIEKITSGPEGVAYKALRTTDKEQRDGPTNGLTEAPCSRCPVFELCEEGGPIGPSNCTYFQEWLQDF